jgi:hypothetical protein
MPESPEAILMLICPAAKCLRTSRHGDDIEDAMYADVQRENSD